MSEQRTPKASRLAYGSEPSQFGELWIPDGAPSPLWPLLVFVHGGWWKSEYDLAYADGLCSRLCGSGVAVWSLEYRRVGSTGGGWPATFQDVASGFDFAATLLPRYRLDRERVLVMGHSAGGHLAFWLAGRHHIPAGSAVEQPRPKLAIHAAIALAGAVDLGLTIDLARGRFAHDRREVEQLMSGLPADVPERYLAGDPGHLLPLNVPQQLLQGSDDDQIPPELPPRWADKARSQGDSVQIHMLPGIGHMDLVESDGRAWDAVLAAVRQATAR